MAETLSKTQLPSGMLPMGGNEAPTFEEGLALGREWAQNAALRVRAWAEANPGQFLLAGVAAGFLVGKLFFGPTRRASR